MVVLVFYVISKDHVIKGDVIFRQEPIKVGYHLVKFGGHRHSGSGDITFLVCHAILT